MGYIKNACRNKCMSENIAKAMSQKIYLFEKEGKWPKEYMSQGVCPNFYKLIQM